VTPRQVFGRLAEAGVSVDLMNVFPDRTSFVVREGDVAETERVALSMFPEKELAYRIIYKPRLQRVMRERYRIQ